MFAGRYGKRSGAGTVIALMLPYFVALTIVWTLFFVVWYLIGIPLGSAAEPARGDIITRPAPGARRAQRNRSRCD